MKKIYLLFFTPLLFAACKPKPKLDLTAPVPVTVANYPYKIEHPDNWVTDTSHANTLVALNALKSYETMDTALMKKCFADSITFLYDGGMFKGTSTQFVKMAATMDGAVKSIKLKVYDWQAVTGKDDPKGGWVNIWYTQYNTGPKGKIDSVDYVNDMQFKGGKIVVLQEFARHFKEPGK